MQRKKHRIGIRMKGLHRSAIAATIALTAFAGNAWAVPASFDMTWSGAAFGNNAKAVGFISFDDPTIPNIDHESAIPAAEMLSLTLTITGATSGNGTFDKASFSSVFFSSPSPLDLSKELVGQPLSNGSTFGPHDFHPGTGNQGDFNLNGATPDAPVATFLFTLTTEGGLGESLMLMSLAPPVAEPDTALMMLVAGGTIGAALIRRRKAVGTA